MLDNFIFSLIISGDNDGNPMIIEDAAANLKEWLIECPEEIPEGITPAELATRYNEILREVKS